MARKPVTEESSKETVKTIAQGMPGDSGEPVVTNARAFYTTRAAAGASGIRHSLRPLIFEGGLQKTSGAISAAGNFMLFENYQQRSLLALPWRASPGQGKACATCFAMPPGAP